MPEPRTAREFLSAGLVLRVACRCGHHSYMDPMTVAFIYGDDFDFQQDHSELYAVIRCEFCNHARPIITFVPGYVSEATGRAVGYADEGEHELPWRAVAGGLG